MVVNFEDAILNHNTLTLRGETKKGIANATPFFIDLFVLKFGSEKSIASKRSLVPNRNPTNIYR
jgi:hypothetical protein